MLLEAPYELISRTWQTNRAYDIDSVEKEVSKMWKFTEYDLFFKTFYMNIIWTIPSFIIIDFENF